MLLAAVLAVLFASASIVLPPIYYHASLDWVLEDAYGWLTAILQSIALAIPLFLLILVVLMHSGDFWRWSKKFDPIKRLSFSWNRRSVLIIAGIIMVAWLPWIIIYYPGSTPYDPVAQIFQMQGSGAFRPEIWEPTIEGWISNSHPILHTLILGGFFELGNTLGSQNLGIFFYSIFQCLVRALCFAVACCYLRRLGVPKLFSLLSLAFFALFPAISTSSMVTFKDHLFSPIYVIYVLQIIEIVRTRGAVLKGKKFVLGFTASSLLLPLFKHPGIYIVLLTSLCLLVVYRRYLKQLLISMAVPAFVIYLIFPYLLFPALQVVPAGSQDVFGPMLAQTARVIYEQPDAMNIEEREIIDRVVPYRIMATGYSTASTDFIKGHFRQSSSLGQRLDYLALWGRQGFMYPLDYFESYFTIQGAWFVPSRGWDVYDNLYPDTHQQVVDIVGHNNRLPFNNAQEVREQLYFDGPAELQGAKQFMRNAFLYLHKVPIIGVLFSHAFYTFYLPLIIAAALFLNKRRFLPIFFPVVLTLVVLLISPMDMSRYALPMLEASPLILGVAILAWMYPEKRAKSEETAKIAVAEGAADVIKDANE